MHADETRGLLADFLSRGAAFIISALGYTPANKAGDTFGGTVNVPAFNASGNVALGDAQTDLLNVGAGGLVKDGSNLFGFGQATPLWRAHFKAHASTYAIGLEKNDDDSLLVIGYVGGFGAWTYSATFIATGAYKPMIWRTSDTTQMTLDVNGNLGIGSTPGGTYKLEVNGKLSINSATLVRTATNFTNGAAAAAGTLLNAPAAGNPTKWIPVDDNGVTRYIPAW